MYTHSLTVRYFLISYTMQQPVTKPLQPFAAATISSCFYCDVSFSFSAVSNAFSLAILSPSLSV